jgi:preprotein translocase subunit SecG
VITFITVLQIIAALILIASVLLQQPKGGGTAFGGSSQSVFGSTGATTFMFRLTMWSAILIMTSSLFLAWYRNNESRSTVVNMSTPPPAATATQTPVEAAAATPATSEAPKTETAPKK